MKKNARHKHPFRQRKAKSTKDGYGNRIQTFCNGCDSKVDDSDPGNSAGWRYHHVYLDKAIKAHLKTCVKAQRIVRGQP